MEFAILRNRQGGNDDNNARYQRISAHGWKDFVLEDACMIEHSLGVMPRMLVIDIGIPTYRLDVEFLERICSLSVPQNWRSTFIIIVDNPTKLQELTKCGYGVQLNQATRLLEEHLKRSSNGQNNVRVRVNTVNSGASASRNRVINESSAEYILFLDDDVIPAADLLFQYDSALAQCLKEDTNANMLGLIGMVHFPRSPTLPMLHAGVLMSYLTFMFEIAACPAYQHPAWGVTANIMVQRKSNVIFDTDYAKTGGGEDVDFCLQLGRHVPEGRFHAVPHAVVEHPFWKGNFVHLAHHFFNWAIGDSALFLRFPQHTFRSSLNASEMIALTVIFTAMRSWPFMIHVSVADYLRATSDLLVVCLCYVLIDVVVELSNRNARRHRIALLGNWPRSNSFFLGALVLAHMYVMVLEFGRLWGHFKRGHMHCVGLRFDWHCGRLPNHRRNYRRLELEKFSLFLVVMAVFFHGR
jgi:GT2 family glycosyltransferase